MPDVRRSSDLAVLLPLLLLVAFLAGLTACRGGTPVLLPGSATSIAGAVSLTFWAKAGATPPPGAIAGQNDCGATLSIVSMHVPKDNPALEPAIVHEIDENAKVLRTWFVPINLTPVAVDRDNLLLRGWDASRAMLQVHTDGLVSVRSVPQLARPEATVCPPRPIEQYAAETLCVSTHDIKSKRKLLLEFEQPCE